jgi:hypothetical protein
VRSATNRSAVRMMSSDRCSHSWLVHPTPSRRAHRAVPTPGCEASGSSGGGPAGSAHYRLIATRSRAFSACPLTTALAFSIAASRFWALRAMMSSSAALERATTS